MKVHQIFTDNELRNFNYVIALDNGQALVIDPWDAKDIIKFLGEQNLTLTTILNTHEHWDHTQGNLELVEHYQCEVWAHENGRGKIPGLTRTLSKDEIIELDNNAKLQILDTPGHTLAHLCFLLIEGDKTIAVFTGDTLFNAGVGRCDGGGEVTRLYKTISEQFATLDDHIVVYPGHEYLENNLNFTLRLEPSNSVAQDWLSKVESFNPLTQSLLTTIGDEKEINTFFRLDKEEIHSNLELTNVNNLEVFTELRKKRDHW